MTSKAGPPNELLEPIQNFLQSFTQELTEQQFIPAFREELRRVVSAIDNLQQSEESLQQIARGVDRLREVFAPAGTRLLEGVKDLESVMRTNATDLRDRSGQVLKDLLETHDKLEAALRSEAGIIQEQTSASREALARTVADVEGRLETLTNTIETLCRKMEVQATDMVTAPRRTEGSVVASAGTAVSGAVTVALPDEVRTLLSRTEQMLNSELERQRREFLAALQQTSQQHEERLARVDHTVERAVSAVAPRVQEDIDQALLRLEQRLQTRMATGTPAPHADSGTDKKAGHTPAVAPEALAGVITATENRMLDEIAALRKALRNDQEAISKSTQDLAHELDEASRKQMARVADETRQLNESLVNLQRLSEAVAEDERHAREQLAVVQANLQSVDSSHKEAAKQTLELLWSQSELLARKVDEDRHLLGQLSAAISRAEQAATTATDRAHSESRTLREKIDSSLKELSDRLQRDLATETDRVQDTLRQLAQAWQSELGTLREDIGRITGETANTLTGNLRQIQTQLEDNRRADQGGFRDLQSELNRTATALDERVSAFQTSSEKLTGELQTHVKAVSNEVSKARASQEQSLAVLKEAIRANYDESSARLREIVEAGYDNFVKQIATIPQALERYATLIQSLHQADHIALQGISTDTKNIVSLATSRFETLVGDTTAIKKFFPLLDKKVERHSAELDQIRKAQTKHDKDVSDVKGGIAHANDRRDAQAREIRDDIRGFRGETDQSLTSLKTELKAMHEVDLPAFRREFATLLTTKFDMMETTVRERQEAIRTEIFQRMDRENIHNGRIYLLLGLLAVLATTVQISVYILNHPGILRP